MDLIIVNGNVVTMDAKLPVAQGVAVKNGRIAYVGSNEDVLSYQTESTVVIDLEGKLMVPGFNDSHMHLLSYGESLMKANLVDTTSIEDLIDTMKAFIKDSNLSESLWIQGRGWNHDHFTVKKFPTRYDLDKVSTDYPVIATRACGHVSVVNSKALEIAGITRDTPQPDGGHFDVDENGEALGILRETALNLVLGCVPEPSVEYIKELLVKAAKDAATQGITSVQSDDFEAMPGKNFARVVAAYKELASNRELPLRVYQQCLFSSVDKLNNFLKRGLNTGVGDEFYKIGPLKLLADGSLGARTAYMCEPYADDPTTQGISVFNQGELDELVLTAHNSGMQVAIHCIGDKTMYMSFESYHKAQKNTPRENHRHSIIHCQITDEALLDKYRDQNIIAHIQPIFIDYDMHILEARVGKKKANTSYNWKSMFDRGVNVACGSDCPVEPFNVLHGIYSAVTRKDLKGYPENGWMPEQRITVEQALHGYTLGAAYASFEEDIKGSITPGKLADFTVLSEDIFSIEQDEIKNVKVLKTVLNGNIVYEG